MDPFFTPDFGRRLWPNEKLGRSFDYFLNTIAKFI
jgi:hypothetical protein